MSHKCTNCGKELPDEAKYCLHCCKPLDLPADETVTKKRHVLFKLNQRQPFFWHFTAKRKKAAAIFLMSFVAISVCFLAAGKIHKVHSVQEPKVYETVLVTSPNGEAVTDQSGEKVYETVEVTTKKKGLLEQLFTPESKKSDKDQQDEGTTKKSFLEKIFNKNDGEQSTANEALGTTAAPSNTETAKSETKPNAEQSTDNVPDSSSPSLSEDQTEKTEPSTTENDGNASSEGLQFIEANGRLKITGYTGNASTVIVPAYINGKRVAYLGENAFSDNNHIKKIIFEPSEYGTEGSVTFFLPVDLTVFSNLPNLTVIEFPYETHSAMVNSDYTSSSKLTFNTLIKNCPKLSAVNFSECKNPDFTNPMHSHTEPMWSEGGVVMTYNSYFSYTLAYYPIGKTDKSYTVSSKCITIDKKSIANNPYLETLYIPSSIRLSLMPNFFGCSNLQNFVVDKNNKTYKSVNGVMYNGDGLTINDIKYAGVTYPPGRRDAYYEFSYDQPLLFDMYTFCANPYLKTFKVTGKAYVYSVDLKRSDYGPKSLETIILSKKNGSGVNDSKIYKIEYFE